MPLHKTSRIFHPGHLTLRNELIGEWRNPKTGKAAEPVIHEADPGNDEPIHLYVVWSKWQGLAPTDRSEVILDAFEAVRGPDQMTRVAVAMGFTPEEAPAFGLSEPEENDAGSASPARRKARPRGRRSRAR
jgi:hypothetical protein